MTETPSPLVVSIDELMAKVANCLLTLTKSTGMYVCPLVNVVNHQQLRQRSQRNIIYAPLLHY